MKFRVVENPEGSSWKYFVQKSTWFGGWKTVFKTNIEERAMKFVANPLGKVIFES